MFLTVFEALAKLAEHVVTQVGDKKIDARLDQKKVAARSFFGLYESLGKFERVVGQLLAVMKTVENGEFLYSGTLLNIKNEVETAQKEFYNFLTKLGTVITIYDGHLGRLLKSIYADDREAVSYMYGINQGVDSVVAATVNSSDAFYFEAVYLPPSVRKNPHRSNLSSAFKRSVDSGHVSDEDRPLLGELKELLLAEQDAIDKAQKMLGDFISKHFEMSDLLAAKQH
jgi:hypothetical protein